MYKLLLVDDEKMILEGLKNLISWEKIGITIIGTAQDGREALRYIEEFEPDIVISDIAMPNCSGIELLQKINEKGWNIKVILLSGYQEFQYAREAVRYDAVDYLLKPVAAEELERVVRQTVQHIQIEQSAQIFPKKDGPVEILFQNVLQGLRKDLYLQDLATLVEIQDFPGEGAVCVAARIVHKNSVVTDDNKNLIRFEIYELIQQWLNKNHCGVVIKKEYNTCFFLIFGDAGKQKIKERCEQLTLRIKEKYPVELLIGVGSWTDWEGNVLYLYKTARFSVELYYFLEKKYIDCDQVSKEYENSFEEYQACLQEIKEQIVIDYQLEKVLDKIKECIELLGNIHYGNKNAVLNNAILMAGEIFSTMKEYGVTDEYEEQRQTLFLEEIRMKGSFRLMEKAVVNHYEEIFLRLKLLGRNREVMEIAKMKKYIQEHYKDNVTLDALADYIGMNPSYMSVFFKKETGQNFKAYLTEVRMKEALKLMNNTDMKSYELAAAVGYRDAKQFRENFKEYYGVSPQKYRKGNQETEI